MAKQFKVVKKNSKAGVGFYFNVGDIVTMRGTPHADGVSLYDAVKTDTESNVQYIPDECLEAVPLYKVVTKFSKSHGREFSFYFNVGDVVSLVDLRDNKNHRFERPAAGRCKPLRQYVPEDCVEEIVEDTPAEVEPVPEPVAENSSHGLVLLRAEFVDNEGRKVVVKRSKCRHYYVKVDGSNQQRVSLDEVKRVIADV